MIEESSYQPINSFEYPDLPSIDLNSSLDSNKIILDYSKLLEELSREKYLKDLINWANLKENNEDTMPNNTEVSNTIEVNNISKINTNLKGYSLVKNTLDKMIKDPIKKSILLKIAEKESGFNHNAKNPKSSASGLFGFINSTKQKFGYGNTIEELIRGASNLYDNMYSLLLSYVNKYGNKGKSLDLLMYGMWFRPKSLLNYLKTGKDSYTDALGTNLNKIFSKMALHGMKINYAKSDSVNLTVLNSLGYNPKTKKGKFLAAIHQTNSFNRRQSKLTNSSSTTNVNYIKQLKVVLDKNKNPHIVNYKYRAPNVEMSGADPVGLFVVESAGLGLLGSLGKLLGYKAVKKFGNSIASKILKNDKLISYMEGPKPGLNIRLFKESILELEKKNGSVGKTFKNPDAHLLQRNVYREAKFLPEIKSNTGLDYRKVIHKAITSKESNVEKHFIEAENIVKNSSSFKSLLNLSKALEGIKRVRVALQTAKNPSTFDFKGFSDMPYIKKKEWLMNDSRNPRGMVHEDLNIPFVANPTDYGNLSVPLHEGEHVYLNILKDATGKHYTSEQAKLLNDTYLTGVNPYTSAIESASKVKEKGAFNKEVLKNIETLYIKLFNKLPNYNELNLYIDNLTPNDLFKALKNNTSKYSQNYLDNIDYVWNSSKFNKKLWVDSFKNSLKYVPVSIPFMINSKNK